MKPRSLPVTGLWWKVVLIACALMLLLTVTLDTGRTAVEVPCEGGRDDLEVQDLHTKGKFDLPSFWPADTPVMIHASVLPDGRVLFWGRDKVRDGAGVPTILDVVGRSTARIWNPANGQFEVVDNNTTNLFCSGHNFLPDGRLLVTGGHKNPAPDSFAGDEHTNIFNPVTRTWSNGPNMDKGRWYPFQVTLETGEVAIVSGTYLEGGVYKKQYQPELYNPQTNALTLLNAPPDAGEFPNYPYLFLDPHPGRNRGVFLAGPYNYFFWNPKGGTDGKGSWSARFTLFLPGTNIRATHLEGSAVMYDSENGSILLAGGRVNAGSRNHNVLNVALTITLNEDNPQWQPTQPMLRPRTFHTLTLLPNGKVLATGGVPCWRGHQLAPCYGDYGEGTVDLNQTKDAEMWNPADGSWTLMASEQKTRGYHSTALLLPDARVLVGGHGLADGLRVPPDIQDDWNNWRRQTTGERNVEIYSPPYLFDELDRPAPRPVINSVPTVVTYGQQFNLTYDNASSISKVTWIRLPSVTHGFNTDQRINVLQSSASAPSQLTVTAPDDPRKCPPGYYMLFILSPSGTPSVARIVRMTPAPQSRESYIARRAVRHNNLIHVFYRHVGDRTLRYMTQTAPDSSTYTQPIDLGGGLNSDPIAIENQDGRLQVFVLGLDNAVYSRSELSPGSGTWSNWVRFDAVSNHPIIAAAKNLDGRIQIFYRGGDNALWHISQTTANSTTWTPPTSLGGGLTSEPAVGMNADGRLEVFVRGLDNSLYHRWQTAAGSSTWSNWSWLGGQMTSDPFVAHNSDGRLSVFIRGTDTAAWHLRQSAPNDSLNWSAWENLGGSLQGDHAFNRPVAAQTPDGRLQVFVRWNDNTLRTMIQDGPGGSFPANNWANLWGWMDATLSPPVRSNNGMFHLFARGPGFSVMNNRQTAPDFLQWSGFTYLGDGAHSF